MTFRKSDSVPLWVIGCSLPLAQIKIESEPEHGVSQLGMIPIISSVLSGDRVHPGRLQPLVAGGYWDLGLVLSGLQASQFSGGKQGHGNEREMREAEVRAVPLARSVWVGLPGDSV